MLSYFKYTNFMLRKNVFILQKVFSRCRVRPNGLITSMSFSVLIWFCDVSHTDYLFERSVVILKLLRFVSTLHFSPYAIPSLIFMQLL